MKQRRIYEAYPALLKLSNQELPIREAWNVAKQLSQLKPFWEFQADEERKFIATRDHEFKDGGLWFKTIADKEAFNSRVNEILDLDQEVEIKPFKIIVNDDIRLTAQDVQALQGEFIDFVEE